MLHLTAPTDPGWFDRVRDHMPTVLLDHAHLEKRAASTALSMIFRYADDPVLAVELSEVVREEMEHFERVVGKITGRGLKLDRLEPAPYAAELVKRCAKKDPDALLDRLLAASLIEARSCERFQILAEHVEDDDLSAFYAELYVDEARHHTLYTSMARDMFGKERAMARLDELAAAELAALQSSTGAPRLHCW